MAAWRPFDRFARSASTILRSVRASVGSLIVSPGTGGEPSGLSQYFWLCGQLLKNSRLPRIACAVSGRKAKPSPLDRTSRNLLEAHGAPTLQHRQCRVQCPGTTAGLRPAPSSVFSVPRDSTVAPFGAHPWPTIEVTLRALVGYKHERLTAEAASPARPRRRPATPPHRHRRRFHPSAGFRWRLQSSMDDRPRPLRSGRSPEDAGWRHRSR